jgi:acyl-CoA thioesterase FadM
MAADVLTTWGVVLHVEVDGVASGERPEPAARWFAEARRAYFERCPRLEAFLHAEEAELRLTAEQVGQAAGPSCAGSLRIGVSVIEVRPSSFDMAVRVRTVGDEAGRLVDGRCTFVVERCATAERIPIPREVRDEFSALQLAARELC